MSSREHDHSDEASIAQLLRAAGRGPTASDEARSRIYRAVQAEWRSNVNSKPARQRSEPRAWSLGLNAWFLRGLPVAAALAVAVVVLYVVQAPDSSPRVELATVAKATGTVTVAASDSSTVDDLLASAVLSSGDTVTTGSDGAASLTLENGLILRVNSGSELLMASNDTIEVRRGTVYVDSGTSPEASSQLEIDTPFGAVWHRGTQYEVRVGSNNIRIRVREGSIGFRDSGNADAEYLGEAGEQLLISEGSDQPVRSTIASSGPEWQWVEGLATAPSADEYLLMDLLEWVARETGRDLRFATDALAQTASAETLSGIAGLTPAETLEAIGSTTAIRYELTDGSLLIF
jgi:ferric-dicitrate binding protein FerR (iron transport regulator)